MAANAPKSAANFSLDDFIPYRLSLLSNTVSEGIAASYRKVYGLSVTEWRVLAILGQYPGLTASEVMQRGAMDKVTVSRAVGKLRDRGLVKKIQDPKDRRRQSLRLTEKEGRRVHAEVVPEALAYEARLLDTLDRGDLKSLLRLLEKLQNAANEQNRQKTEANTGP